MIISTFVPIGKLLKDVLHIVWNELPYPILYLRKVCIFMWYFDEIKLYAKDIQPKIPFGHCDSGGWLDDRLLCQKISEFTLKSTD